MRPAMMALFPLLFCFIFLCISKTSIAVDTLTPNQNLRDNGSTLVSIGESFELGFFSPPNSNDRYIGIWFGFKDVHQQTVVWVANKDKPISDSSGVFTINATGNVLILSNQSSPPVWSSNSSTTSPNPVLRLLDDGNLVVLDSSNGNYLWQSFDYPCDTIIPGMKIGSNLVTNRSWHMTSWASAQDPSTGAFTYKVDHRGIPQLLLRQGSTIEYRSGPWDGIRFGGGPRYNDNLEVFIPYFVYNINFVYYTFEYSNNATISRFVVDPSGKLEHLSWKRGEWVDVITLRNDQCDVYEQCGPNGFCNINVVPECYCPPGFIPRAEQDWRQLDWFSGCVRRTPLNCSADEGFLKFSKVKLPDNSTILVNNTTMTVIECQNACFRNCSCMAYAHTDVSGCVAWFGDLVDIRTYNEGGQDLYIRMAASDIQQALKSKNNKRRVMITSVSVVLGVLLLLAAISFVIWRGNSKRRKGSRHDRPVPYDSHDAGEEDLDQLPLFNLLTVESATNKFSHTNKIGEGGFGAVYKGQLPTGQEVAVKRLSKDSGQGLKEFTNEVIFISKLQHRNLVRLLGCCIHGEERMLVYEYMVKGSLDRYLYNQTKGTSLDWQIRFNIIVGIARGLLYLHRDSRLRIIHRDLKTSNILLDGEMNPKISDFGLARTFGGDQNAVNTNRVIGTYGYMSPEYAIDGLFSVKSDVFSLGVLVLEIVSGNKNRGFYHPDHNLNLLGHAWRLWVEGRQMELMDPLMEKPASTSELLKCIHIGLLCVQQRPEDRPNMSSVVLMLDSDSPILPQPKQPGFYTERFVTDADSGSKSHTLNEVTVTMIQGR